MRDSSSSVPGFCLYTGPFSEVLAVSLTRTPGPKPGGLRARSSSGTVKSQILLVIFQDAHKPGADMMLQGHIRYLLSTGKTEWESMERYIDGL